MSLRFLKPEIFGNLIVPLLEEEHPTRIDRGINGEVFSSSSRNIVCGTVNTFMWTIFEKNRCTFDVLYKKGGRRESTEVGMQKFN